MYDSNWFTMELMTEWEEQDNRTKIWEACKAHFEWCYITKKRYHMEEVNMINTKFNQFWDAMEE